MKSELNIAHFTDEAAAFAFVEAHLWPDGPVCPHCGTLGEATRSKGKTTRAGLWNCRACRKPFTVRMGTVFESSHVPMHIWLQVIYLICSSKKGISTRQVQRTIGGSMKTAWFLTHRVRAMMAPHSDVFGPLGGEGKVVEVDETFIGKKADAPPNPWQFSNERGWHRARNVRSGDKLAVVTLVERGGEARSFVADDTTTHELRKIIMAQADTRSALMTDQWRAYLSIGRRFASHETVNHSADEYVRGDVHTNTVEGFFSVFKRGMRGIYQHCDQRHLHRYLAEFDFRYSNRSALGVEDVERSNRALKGASGKRLTYETTRSQA